MGDWSFSRQPAPTSIPSCSPPSTPSKVISLTKDPFLSLSQLRDSKGFRSSVPEMDKDQMCIIFLTINHCIPDLNLALRDFQKRKGNPNREIWNLDSYRKWSDEWQYHIFTKYVTTDIEKKNELTCWNYSIFYIPKENFIMSHRIRQKVRW